MLIMNVIPNVAVNTLVLASMYILASLGFAFIFNMLGSVNLAHGRVLHDGGIHYLLPV